jgi:hypothetical protein
MIWSHVVSLGKTNLYEILLTKSPDKRHHGRLRVRRTDIIEVNGAEMGYEGLSWTDLALLFRLVKSCSY